VSRLRRFCREWQWNWRGLVSATDLFSALQHSPEGITAVVTTGQVVRLRAVIVPNLTMVCHPSDGMDVLHRLARWHVAVHSVSEELTEDEMAWMERTCATQEGEIAA
jgi:chloramphenicol 3-O-phosphotransferase